jgi:adenylate cyclase
MNNLIKYSQGLLLLAILSLPLIFQSTPTEILKLKLFDSLVETPEASGNFAILNITEVDVDKAGGYPLPREDLAKIHLDLLRNGAIGVGWVLAFPHADRFGGDVYLKSALAYAPSVIALFENDNGIYPKTTGTVILGDDVGGYLSQGTVKNIDDLSRASLEGIASAPVDVDNLVRRIPLLYRTPDGWIAAFGTQVLKSLTGSDTYIIRTNDNGIEEVTVKGLPPVKVDSYGRKWISWIVPHETSLTEMDVEGKFVFVGVTAKGVMPQLATPVGLLEPHYIQAALAESLLVQNSPFIPDYSLALEVLIFIVSMALLWLLTRFLGITWGLLSFLIVLSSTAYFGYYQIKAGLLIDVSWTLISQFILASVAFYMNFREQFKLRLQIKKQFEHYLDPRQVKKLQKNPSLLKLGGEKRVATYLFTDVRGFTSLSEQLPPDKVTYIMNKALTAQQTAVQKHEGMVDKYIGDAMMAIFNAPLDQDKHFDKAIECAKDIVKNMKELNKELKAEALPTIAIGIGINTGEAVIGNMGSASRFDYTAIGDAVNTAARLESATKEAKVDILIGENTANISFFDLRYIDDIQVKGKAFPIKVYGI